MLWLLGAEAAVVHAHFHLLGHVVGTATERKLPVSDSLGRGNRALSEPTRNQQPWQSRKTKAQ